jgi:DNA sulfur modification protein DndB
VKKSEPIVLPALRGVMGDWVFYSCLMNLETLATRVHYAEEVHKNTFLSDMIQRQLTRGRSTQIATYLRSQPERFFNSLVVATYGGHPNWHALSEVKSRSKEGELQLLDEDTISSVGFLTLRGDEKLFALDGQHRLAGIKKAVKDGLDQDPLDEVSVLFVAHKETKKGLERTRRLFTTLNKTARPVSKGDIIALDEDDVMAISVRWLIEESTLFSGNRIAFVATNNMPVGNTTSLTTIGNLYDILTILFTNANSDLRRRKAELQRVRPCDDDLKEYFDFAKEFFVRLRENFQELDTFFAKEDTVPIVKECRGSHGGNALFRPIGLEILARIVARLTKDMSLPQAVGQAAKLPTTLTEPPYDGLMWDSSSKTILNSHKVTLREVLLNMLGKSKYSEATLLQRYRRETGHEGVELPAVLES